MEFKQKIALLMILATLEFPCVSHAAEEDGELAMIAAERSKSNERLGEINSVLTDSLSTKRTQETDRDIKERRKKLNQTRKEKEKDNERRLKESANQKPSRNEETIVIDPSEPEITPAPSPAPTQPITPPAQLKPAQPITAPAQPKPTQPITPPAQPAPAQPITAPAQPKPTQPVTPPSTVVQRVNTSATPPANQNPPPSKPTTSAKPAPRNSTPPAPDPTLMPSPKPVETLTLPDQKLIYANFVEVAQAMHFVPLYMTKKSGYDITAIYAGQGIVEIRYGRRWEPNVSLAVRTYKRAAGEDPQDISGVENVKWRVDTSTGTTIYIAKISDTQQVAAWAVGQYTFSAQAENLSFATFHSLVADELVELSTHYYVDL